MTHLFRVYSWETPCPKCGHPLSFWTQYALVTDTEPEEWFGCQNCDHHGPCEVLVG